MKKSKKIILIVAAIIAILVSFLGGQAYAKYMSKVTGNGTAEIASWKFKVNENEEKMQTISLSSTINNFTLANGKIAPGTSGSFQIKLEYLENIIVGGIDADENDKTRTITINWNWDFETGSTEEEIALNNKIDTDESKYIKDYSFDVVVTGTQISPQG